MLIYQRVTLFASRGPFDVALWATSTCSQLYVSDENSQQLWQLGMGLCGANILVWEFLKIMLVNYIIWIY